MTTMTLTINNNTIQMSQYKGQIKRCPFCTPKQTGNKEIDDRNLLEAMSNTAACKWCMSQRFVSICLNCNGTGKYNGKTIWDGGQHDHVTSCNPCASRGMYPARKPADWVEPPLVAKSAVEPVAAGV
jgi:hypothetical protein